MTGKLATVWHWSSVTAGMVATAGAPVISETARAGMSPRAGKLATGWMPATAEKSRKHGHQQKKRHKQLQKQEQHQGQGKGIF
jgi:hypothetical protein